MGLKAVEEFEVIDMNIAAVSRLPGYDRLFIKNLNVSIFSLTTTLFNLLTNYFVRKTHYTCIGFSHISRHKMFTQTIELSLWMIYYVCTQYQLQAGVHY